MITKDLFFNLVDVWRGEHELYSVQGTVKSVDESLRTCVVSPVDGADLLDVRLEADYEETATDPKGFFVVPAVGSLVLVSFLDKNDAYISCWTSIAKVIMKTPEWIFNDGANEGIVIAPELKTQVDKNTEILNQIQTAFTNWVTVPSDGGAALKALSTAFVSLARADLSSIQNPKIKH